MSNEECPPKKDRLIQTRVPRDLESTLKAEARRQRLSVSHLIRNVLEESLQLVDGVVADVDQIVSDSVKLARNVTRSAARVASAGRAESPAPRQAPPAAPVGEAPHAEMGKGALDQVYAWSEVVLHKAVACSHCGGPIGRGETGYAGLSEDASLPGAWLCGACIEAL